ncbi:MAPEG family protein [Mesorhizobium tamadayense]|uniref:MAPEG family protein n=1 Tax=Mesorhizobium tamadayense TaxID=425306 RepID=UPI00197E3350
MFSPRIRRAFSEVTAGRPAPETPKSLRSRGWQGRLERALRSFVETFPVFVAAVFLVHAVGHEAALSKWGAGLYFSARLVYLPLYAFGVPLLRSLVWNVAFFGIVLLLLASVLPLLGNS